MKFDKTITIGLLILVVFSALAHGTVEPWSVLLFEIIVSVLMLIWAVKCVVDRKLNLRIPAVFWPLLTLTVLGILQSISFETADGARRSLSMDVEATRGAVMMLVALLAAALLAANFLASEERAGMLMKFFTVFGFALALFGIIQYFAWNEKFFWLRPAGGESTPFGPFANRNHFAGYMEMLLAWPVVALIIKRRNRDERFFYALAAAWIGAAAIFTMSRGGMISIISELLLIGALIGFLDSENSIKEKSGFARRIRQAGAVIVIIAAIFSGVLWLGAEKVVNRIAPGIGGVEAQTTSEQNSFSASRGELWRGGCEVFKHYPIIGAGLGAFEISYSIYSGENGKGPVTAHAHNDYLQILADGGIIGGIIAVWFIVIVVLSVRKGLKSNNDAVRATTLACGAGIFGLLVHSLFDFNLQLPSHALLFITLSVVMNAERGDEITFE